MVIENFTNSETAVLLVHELLLQPHCWGLDQD